ncbi:MAG: hypothetical protein ACYDCN_10575 [Bacteroidia bacterium]
MTQQEAAEVMEKEQELSKEAKTKWDRIDAFLQQAHKVLEECNYYITTCAKYLNSPDDGGKNAPIPAWRGANPNPYETNRAVEILNELMIEAKKYIIDEIAFKDKYDLLIKKIETYLKNTNKIYELLYKVKPDAPDRLRKEASRKAYTEIEKMPSYIIQINAIILQLDALISQIASYEQCMKSIKNKINMLKGVN